MFGYAAVFAFGLAVLLHVFAKNDEKIVTDAWLFGLLFLAAHLTWPLYPWRRRSP